MLSSIHPLGERGRGNRFYLTAAAFVVGSVAGGATTGLVLGSVGSLVDSTLGPFSDQSLVVVLLAASAVGVAFDLSGRQLPSLGRQVNEEWLAEFRGWVYGSGFGFQLGMGVATYITAAALVPWLASMVVVANPATAALIGATFGLIRGLSIVAVRQVETPDQLRAFHVSLHRTAASARIVGILILISMTATVVVYYLAMETQ